MKSYKDIKIEGKRVKNGRTWNWVYTYTLNNETIGTKTFGMKQNRLEQLAFNFCLANGLTSLIHPSTF